MNDRPLVTHHPLAVDYLRRLETAAQVLGPARSSELVGEIRAHIAEGVREAGGDEAAVRNVLQRLGSVEEIVAEADDRPASYPQPGHPQAPVARPESTWLELVAVLLMTVGSVIPLLGWLTGIILLWLSRWLHWWEKLIATLIVPGGLGGLGAIGLMTSRTCTSALRG